MSSGLNVRVDLGKEYASLRAQFSTLAQRDVKRSAARALNRVAVTARREVAPVIAQALNNALPEPVIRRAIKFRNARSERLFVDLTAVGGKRIMASLFKPRQTKTGVTIRIGTRSVNIPGAFITPKGAVRLRGPDWTAQFFNATNPRNKRLAKAGPDYPIPQIYVPGVPRVFLQTQVRNAIERVARVRFPVEFRRELEVRSRGFVKARG